MRKLLRTLQVQFPYLLEMKVSATRLVRTALKIPFEHDFNALALFPPGNEALFLDIGANRGQSTDAILMQRSNARIQLFEPNEILCKRLRTLFGGNRRITINDFGLGDEASESTLFVPFYNGWMFDGLASFNEDMARNWLKGRVYLYDERRLVLHKSRCRIRRLDELQLAPFFIKIDTQGYEYRTLKGAEQTLRTHEPVLLTASPDDRTMEFLKSLGYRHYAFQGGRFVPGVEGELNTYFMTEGKSTQVQKHIAPGRTSS